MTCLGAADARAASDTMAAIPSSKIPFEAQDSVDSADLVPLPADGLDLTTVEAADWKPEPGASVEAKAPATPAEAEPAGKSVETTSDKGADTSDPEPDGVVVPKSPSPSHDPLDRPTPAAGAPTQAGAASASKPAEEPLPALNAALKAALDKRATLAIKGPNASEQRKEREAVAFFYAAHGFAPAWSEDGKVSGAVAPVLAGLKTAEEDALTLSNVPSELKATGTPEEIAESDIALTEAVVAYARQATGSRIDPHSISPLIGAKPDLADPAEVVDALVAAGQDSGAKLRALNPSDSRYVALRDKLAELRGKVSRPESVIDPGPTLKIGMSDPRVPTLRTRLEVEAPVGDEDVYDAELSAAVVKFQRGKGLRATGTLNGATVTALNGHAAAPSPQLEATIVANMEMWRWLPRDLGADRIEVNVPDYVVKVFHDNEPVASHRVVVGKTTSPTPLFSNTMKFLIVNPAWNVPQSIIKNEFGGAARGFKARYVHGQLFLQQPPGPGNALGRIKFLFPNEYSVYLHDTPAKALFGTSRRAYSHGCVRVDKPFDFAESVLNDGVPEGGQASWSVKRLEKMLGTTERYVDLPKPLPIHIEYFTASVDGSGHVVTREDIYGYTAAVATALGLHGEKHPLAVPVAAGQASKRLASGADGERRSRRHRSHPSRRYPDGAEEGTRQAYAPPETGRGSYSQPFGFLPF